MGRLEEAQQIQKTSPAKAEAVYKEILSKEPGTNDAALREYELTLMALGELYRDSRCVGMLFDGLEKCSDGKCLELTIVRMCAIAGGQPSSQNSSKQVGR